MGDREKEQRKKRDKRKIKTEIHPSQLQTAITFDRKLRLRRAIWPHKSYDDIYRDCF
jgi:hypothetical protein